MDRHPLLTLQNHDLDADRHNREMKKLHQRLTVLDADSAAARRALDELRHEEKALSVDVRRVEGEIDSCVQQKFVSEEKLLKVTTAKQFDALKAQIASIEERHAELEISLLELYERHEGLSAAVATAMANLESVDATGVAERTEIENGLRRHQAELASVVARRPDVAAAVPQAMRRRYDVLHDRHGGRVAMDTDDMACPGCGMALPRQDFEKMKSHREDFFDCADCGRLLRYVGV